ncbi:FAD-dependent oxidoreductase [Synechococcales cyanobacterium C]|uniref:NADH:ubiquinone reductase (non-electrogenic) n=1 Tax=Petrachloros mirabilis ULC683 TaxID=2781853 RepID=A0A8K1ZXM8_9CYAN|nr:FAD-dependent oxidoreductase [Petrachloros mirabilis ULC683]
MAESQHHVVIVGGGFGGLYAAKALRKAPVKVTLIDQRNFHLFQPLLYQVATGTLSPADISSPLRGILSKHANTQVLMDKVTEIDPQQQQITLIHQTLSYDTLIVATGVRHHYFGNAHWQDFAPGLKTVEDALELRRRIFLAFEAAEREPDPVRRRALLTFVIVGGGPTGVELAGAIAELAFKTLPQDFRNINTQEAQVLLLEGLDRVLPPYPPELSAKAAAYLRQMGVTVRTQTRVTHVDSHGVTVEFSADQPQAQAIPAHTILWAAGVQASPLGQQLAERTGAELDRVGRVKVSPHLNIPGYENLYVIGDLAHVAGQNSPPLPGVAPVAVQEGKYVAKQIQARLQGQALAPFQYKDVGSLAVIGQNAAVVDFSGFKFTGIAAWLIWVFAHIYYLIEFDNKLIVMLQWGWNYFTRQRGARLITHPAVPEQVEHPSERAVAKTPTSVP